MEGDAFQLAFFPRFRRISIHSLRMEGDYHSLCRKSSLYISIHSLRMEGDVKKHLFQGHELDISIHSLRMEGD